jgi:leukotriene-A4 hydrolase
MSERGAAAHHPARRARQIRIAYRSAPDAEALQWLTPEQTAGKKHPYPVQPGPGDPQPHLDPDPGQPRHPPDLGSADHRARAAEGGDVGRAADARGRARRGGGRAFRFRMDKPVAPYLIAIAAGDIAFRRSARAPASGPSRRCSTRAAAELVDTEKMVEAAERSTAPIAGAATT